MDRARGTRRGSISAALRDLNAGAKHRRWRSSYRHRSLVSSPPLLSAARRRARFFERFCHLRPTRRVGLGTTTREPPPTSADWRCQPPPLSRSPGCTCAPTFRIFFAALEGCAPDPRYVCTLYVHVRNGERREIHRHYTEPMVSGNVGK